MALTDINKTIANKYAYSPFGTIANQEETVVQPFKFVGQYGIMTEDNGWYYMQARYYDPAVGRFIAEDPIGFDGGDVNLYAYVLNNPVMFIDPEGKWIAQAIGGGIGAIVGGYSAYKSGGDWKDIARSSAVGGGAGVLSTIPIPGLNAWASGTLMGSFAGAAGNVGTQLVTGTSVENVDWQSAGFSALAGGIGGGLGSGVAGITSKQGMPIFTELGQDIIGNTIGGVSAGILDVTFQGSGVSAGVLQGSGK